MGNYPRGEWCDIWDALYRCFLYDKRDYSLYMPRVTSVSKEDKDIKEKYLKYLKN